MRSRIKADVKGNLPSELSFEVKYISCSNREISHIALVDTVFTPMGLMDCRVFMAGYIQVFIKSVKIKIACSNTERELIQWLRYASIVFANFYQELVRDPYKQFVFWEGRGNTIFLIFLVLFVF